MAQTPEVPTRTEFRDGMRITWHEAIAMDDGIVLRADIYRPIAEGRYPVILSHGIYGKGLAYQDGYPMQWQKMVQDHPEILESSTNKYQAWEVTDPERWVPHGYAVVRVDSRGSGWSPGFMDPLCPREDDDLYQCIEWAGPQPWSNGKVGMRTQPRLLKNCTARSCRSAAARVGNVPRLRRLPVRGSFLRE